MLVAESRPRNLGWTHAGPLLFGDWGTSRLYVLGLAFYYTAHASLLYLTLMSVLMIAVAWAYTIVCRCFPEGGGVYSSARKISPVLAVIGATLLLCDFIVTASLSAIEGFHYLGLKAEWVVLASMVTMAVLGVVNWLGARAAGRFALVIALAALITSAAIGVLCLPLLPEGLRSAKWTVEGVDKPWQMWESLVRVVLALAGVEAVASMTGLMKQPVARTAKRTIWPVLIEVVALNLIFGIALNALPSLMQQQVPHYVEHEVRGGLAPEDVPPEVKEYRDTAVKALASHAGSEAFGARAGRVIGVTAGLIFGLLLLSAVNTAIMAMVSVMYALAHDRELPRGLTRLNYSGVPWIGLIIAVVLPALVLLFEADVKALGELYAIGVVGAIAINVVCMALNKELDVKPWERRGLWALGAVMVAIEITIIIAKPNATLFAGSIVGAVLGARWFVMRQARIARLREPMPEPSEGWMAELREGPIRLAPDTPRIMLAARGRDNAEYAVDLARKRKAVLFAIYVRTLRVLDAPSGGPPMIDDDPQGQEALGTVAVIARQAGVAFYPIYVTSSRIAEEILDYTVTFGCDTLIMGKSRRSMFSRKVQGDVVSEVSSMLPETIQVITRASTVQAEPAGVGRDS
jgi:amino acid transporter/nucleotide-binding universal stress UspA family protein